MIILQIVFTIIQLLACLFLIAVVLLQSGKSSGLSGAISGSSDTYLSRNKSKSLDSRLAKLTKWAAVVFAVCTVVLNIIR